MRPPEPDVRSDIRSHESRPIAAIAIEPRILYFGTPVILVSSLNPDGSTNLAPMSSAWALGWTILLGLGCDGRTIENLRRRGECVLNLPTDEMWRAVEALAPLTGRDPVPAEKRDRFRFEPDKFAAAGLTPVRSRGVEPSSVGECPLRLEAVVIAEHAIGACDPRLGAGEVVAVELRVEHVLADPALVEGDHVLPRKWHPLLYNFRHYFGLGAERGHSFRSETKPS